MFCKEYYAVCDICGKRLLLFWCNSISTSSISKLRKFHHWTVRRDGKFVCCDCKKFDDLPSVLEFRNACYEQQLIESEVYND